MSALLLLLKVVLVFGLLAFVLWVLKRTESLRGHGKNRLLEVRGSTRLGKGAALTVVRVDGKDLLLGVTDHTVTLLTSEDAAEVAELRDTTARPKHALSALLGARPQNNVSAAAVAAALASLRGETPAGMDGSVTAPTRLAARRRVARMEALQDKEHPWSHACRPTLRAADGDDALL
ncbi:MAG: Flagellar biosynthesis protein FliO [Frankiales bacterium]|nr:Flagellar biosynthesis protein FliO [Frankiales bacterium]